LLPLSVGEMHAHNLLPERVEELVWKGQYPRIYDQDLDPVAWYLDYIETYVERDARQIINITQLSTFRRFIRLCAARVGQILNIASLAVDCGIDQRTAKAWISVLEASYILFLLQPYHGNFNKRLIKSPKLYFYDSGLACSLLGIQTVDQLHDHYLRGSIIESMVISDIVKHHYNIGERPHNVNFWRDQTGNEVDCIIQKQGTLTPVEIKASKTIVSDFFKGLSFFAGLSTDKIKIGKGYIIYGGSKNQEREQGFIVSWKDIDQIFG
jgi:uncharacterized protein